MRKRVGVGGGGNLLEQNVEKRTEAGDLSIRLAQTPIFLYPFYFFDDGQPEGWHLRLSWLIVFSR
jgi:hypothetical protein